MVRVALVASFVPLNHAVAPCRGLTPRASASPCAATRRAGLLLPQLRLGCTRLDSTMTKEREAKSITTEVPV